MAQKPYKHNIEYIQKYYSYGSEAKVIAFQPRQEQKVQGQIHASISYFFGR